MKDSKIPKNQGNKKQIHFHFPTNSRHLNLRQLLEDHFIDPPKGNSEDRPRFKR